MSEMYTEEKLQSDDQSRKSNTQLVRIPEKKMERKNFFKNTRNYFGMKNETERVTMTRNAKKIHTNIQ